jgi:hypothetical protein
MFSGLKSKPSKKPAEVRSACHLLMLVSCLAYASTLKMEVISSFETSGCLQAAQETRQILQHECGLLFWDVTLCGLVEITITQRNLLPTSSGYNR